MVDGVPADSDIKIEDEIFDADFYNNKYGDLQKAFKGDKAKLLKHWKDHGIKEGRAGSAMLNLKFYLTHHADLEKEFGSDYKKAYEHYLKFGLKEMRMSSEVFSPKLYQSFYPSLASLTPAQLVWHYRHVGAPKGMLGYKGFAEVALSAAPADVKDELFDADFYHNKYGDLQKAFKGDKGKLAKHWVDHGIKEGRAGSEVLDLKFYLQNNGDLEKAFGNDYKKVYEHFLNHGLGELRKSSPTYFGRVYKERYGLEALTPAQLIHHYLTYGRSHYLVAI